MQNNTKALFLEQSYKDVNEYMFANIKSQKYENWDYIVLTASNEEQASNYRLQIQNRLQNGILDARVKFIVISDYKGQRVGSGGATLNVVQVLKDEYGVNFEISKILLIHSGGDSKRIPQYSAVGKLFSAVPREINNKFCSTLFDELIAITSIMPSRFKNGIMIMSGDVALLYNPLQVDYVDGICAISMKKEVEIGKNHGVFLLDDDGCVKEFLHKKSVLELRNKGAVDINGNVDIDTGIILFDGKIAKSFLSLIETNGKTDYEKMDRYINSNIKLSFYGDFLYPFSKKATLQCYLQQSSEGNYCEQLLECRKEIWNVFNNITMRVESVSPAEFLHFGTTVEFLDLVTKNLCEYEYLGWKKTCNSNIVSNDNALYQSLVTRSSLRKNSYIENSVINNCVVGESSILSFVEANDEKIPGGIALSGLKLRNGKFTVRIYGIFDDPKKKLFGESWLNGLFNNSIDKKEVFVGLSNDISMWEAPLFVVSNSMDEAVKMAIMTYSIFVKGKKENFSKWNVAEKISLAESFKNADIKWLSDFVNNTCDKIFIQKCAQAFCDKLEQKDFESLFEGRDFECYIKKIENAIGKDYSALSRLWYFASKKLNEIKKQKEYEDKAFEAISILCKSKFDDKKLTKMKQDKVEVSLSARTNWGGGWTDTPPYCVENGGTVLNAAVLINGIKPIKATVEKIEAPRFIFESLDSDVSVEINNKNEILNCGNPFDPVALQKAAIVAMGIVEQSDDENLDNVFKVLGGGLKLTTQVIDIPRGSGLGTSSILSAACIKALLKALGHEDDAKAVSRKVLIMEQIMSTGGGWQDQIGGLIDGIKMVKTSSGEQSLEIEAIEIPLSAKEELLNRFALIYTGQRRLARNLLRDIVGSYLMSKQNAIVALKKIEEIACLMQRVLEKGDIDQFANLLNEHWEYSKMLDGGSTNTCIDFIFHSINDLIDGRMMCGAGGGGFIQVIMKKNVTKEMLSKRIFDVFGTCGVKVSDAMLLF